MRKDQHIITVLWNLDHKAKGASKWNKGEQGVEIFCVWEVRRKERKGKKKKKVWREGLGKLKGSERGITRYRCLKCLGYSEDYISDM